MAIRWRKNGILLCAAHCEYEEGDCYIDDRLQYQLSVITRAILPDPAHEVNNRYHWVHGTDFLRGVPEIHVLDDSKETFQQGFEEGQNQIKQEVWNGLLKGMQEGMQEGVKDDHK